MKAKTLEFLELRAFEKTKTFQEWNKERIFRDELRNSFLSVSPNEAISTLKDEELSVAYEKVLDILSMNPTDEHYRSVLRKHRRSLERRFGSTLIHSSDSSDSFC